MAELRYSTEQFDVYDNQASIEILLNQGFDVGTIQNLRIIEISHEPAFNNDENTIKRTYQASWSLDPFTNNGTISVDVYKIEVITLEDPTVAQEFDSLFVHRTNKLPLHALPIKTIDERVTYNLMIPTYGTTSQLNLNAVVFRKTIQFQDENEIQLVEGVEPDTGNHGYEMKLVKKADTFTTYDIISVYDDD